MQLQQILLKNEKILWQGAPKLGLYLSQTDWFLIPFSLIWGGFACFWEYTALNQPNAPLVMKLFGAPFVLIGLYLIFGRFLVDAWLRGRTEYAVTNRRVVIFRSAPFARLTTVSLNQLPDANLTEAADGSGSLRFGARANLFGNNQGWSMWTPSLDPTPQFIGIENAAQVFNLIQQSSEFAQRHSEF